MIWMSWLAAAVATPELPNWMSGCWEERKGDRWTEECWTIPRANMMMGSGRSGQGGVLNSWEVMQIEKTDTDDPVIDPLVFYGAPSGKGRTPFAWNRQDEKGVLTFVNTAHDYPQRIRYWREGEELVAETSLADGSKAMRWRYRRMGKN